MERSASAGTVPVGRVSLDRITVELAEQDVPDQHHDNREDRHRDHEAGEAEELSEQQDAGDREHRRKVRPAAP